MMNDEEFLKKVRKHIESLGEIISYLKKKKEDFLVQKLQSVQGFLAYLEKITKEEVENEK